MRVLTTSILLLFFGFASFGQLGQVVKENLYPVKIDQHWGMMNAKGEIVIAPQYDAIGPFKNFGYAVMQKEDRVGLINKQGHEIIQAKYDDIKILDSLVFAVLDATDWAVTNLKGKVILKNGYEQVQIWKGEFIGFRKNRKWGLANTQGEILSNPKFDKIDFLENGFFQTSINEKLGLMAKNGKEILANESSEIKIYNSDLFFFQKNKNWGAVNQSGKVIIRPSFQSFMTLSDNFIKLIANKRVYLYSVAKEKIITKGEHDGYFSFSKKKILVKNNRKLGLMDWNGKLLIPIKYHEIQSFGNNQYRVNISGNWGVVGIGDEIIIPMEYDYIAPSKSMICVVKQNGKLGIVNIKGAPQVSPKYDQILIDKNKAKAYQNGSFTVLNFNELGVLQGEDQFDNHMTLKIGGKKKQIKTESIVPNDYQLENFEWYYDAKLDKWGLRKLVDGSVHIEPVFDWIRMERDVNFTLVGIEKWNKYSFDRTTYRFAMVFGLVNNANGLLVTPVELLDVKLSDFRKKSSAARVIFENGTHGLVAKNGAYLVKDFAFIDEFQNGVARMSMRGKLSGNLNNKDKGLGRVKAFLDNVLSSSYMTDYTQHDQDFRDEAEMTCADCIWGYIDSTGQIAVKPQFSFAENMINGIGLVEKGDKSGAVRSDGSVLLSCQFDQLGFLENTQNQILKIYKNESKYGLIDSLAEVSIDLKYNEIGVFQENLLAVSRKGRWGFVNQKGEEIIPCKYRKVHDFQEGYAAVQLGNKWGFINEHGEIVIEFKYVRVGNFKSGLAWVATTSGVGYINPKGDRIIPPKFSKAFDFEKNVARVVVDGRFGLINLGGDYFLRPKYKFISEFNEHGVAIVQIGKEKIRHAIITRTGDIVGYKKYQKISKFSEGLAAAKVKNQFGFINTQGELVIENEYSKVSNFSEGLAAVCKKGKCGFINKKGEVVIPLIYSRCLDFEEGRAIVYQGMPKAGVIDISGNEIIKPSIRGLVGFSNRRGLIRNSDWNYHFITQEARFYEGYYDYARAFQNGIAVVKKDGKWGIINQNGMAVISPKYDKIEPFENGFAKVKINGFSGLTNLDGEIIVPPNYEFISYAGGGLFRVEQGDKIGYFNSKGDWIWELQN